MFKRKKLVLFLAIMLGIITRLLFWGEIRAWWYRDYIEVRAITGSNWFDYPVGAPNAKGYYRAQEFGVNAHLGEDWNGMGGGNSDYDDPVYSIADGRVSFAKSCQMGWGNVVRIVHPVDSDHSVEALYAHLADLRVHRDQKVKRGQVIGTIGDADGVYAAHLHFEIRTDVGLPLGGGYSTDTSGFCDPTGFIDKHRKK